MIEELRQKIYKAAKCKFAFKDIEVVRETVIIEMPLNELMELIEESISEDK